MTRYLSKKQGRRAEKSDKKKREQQGEKGLNTEIREKAREGEELERERVQGNDESWALPLRRLCYINTHKHTVQAWCAINIQGHLPSTVKVSKTVSETEDEGGCWREKERVKYKGRRKGYSLPSLQISHVSIGNPRCLFMGQYIWIAAPFRSHLKRTALAIDLSGLYSHTAWLRRETHARSFRCQPQICNRLLITQQSRRSDGRAKSAVGSLTAFKHCTASRRAKVSHETWDLRDSSSFQACGDSALQLPAISCQSKAVCTISHR